MVQEWGGFVAPLKERWLKAPGAYCDGGVGGGGSGGESSRFPSGRLMLEHEKGGECLERVFLVCEPCPVAAALPESCHIESEVRGGVGFEAVVCEC